MAYPEIECEAWPSSNFPPLEHRSRLAIEWERDLFRGYGFELDHIQDSVQAEFHIPFLYQPAF